MPLAKGKSQKVVSKNIRELHTGKQYAATKKKHGADVANRQAIAISLQKAGKTKK